MSRKVRFKPDRRTKIPKSVYTIAFVIALLIIVVTSSFVILKNNNFDLMAAIGGESIKKEDEDEDTATCEEERCFLLWCKDSKTNQLEFIWVMRVSLPEGKYEVYSPSLDSTVSYEGNYKSLVDIFSTYGSDGLCRSVETLCSISISSYIGSDTENFKQMINKIGSVTVNLTNQIEYRGDYNLILSSGKNTLKGDQLYKYLCYTNYVDFGASTMRVEVLKQVLQNAIGPDEKSGIDTLYSNIANLLYSNMTIVDYSASTDFINQMFDSGVINYIEITEASGFNKE